MLETLTTERCDRATHNINEAVENVIGTLINGVQDGDAECAKILGNHKELVERVYHDAITYRFETGCSWDEISSKPYVEDIRLLGKDWLLAVCELAVRWAGY